ncbi:MAG: hypothetical protein KA150_05815, partial [Propionivibrio sp.]|nr:hypothetical protein [Propionivibrio sp.]
AVSIPQRLAQRAGLVDTHAVSCSGKGSGGRAHAAADWMYHTLLVGIGWRAAFGTPLRPGANGSLPKAPALRTIT